MQIKVSIAISRGTAESDALPLLTLEVDAQPSIETLGLGLADAKVVLTQLQAQIVTRQVELLSTSQRRCDGCGRNRAIKDYHDIHYRILFGSVVVRRHTLDVGRRLDAQGLEIRTEAAELEGSANVTRRPRGTRTRREGVGAVGR